MSHAALRSRVRVPTGLGIARSLILAVALAEVLGVTLVTADRAIASAPEIACEVELLTEG